MEHIRNVTEQVYVGIVYLVRDGWTVAFIPTMTGQRRIELTRGAATLRTDEHVTVAQAIDQAEEYAARYERMQMQRAAYMNCGEPA
jgi:hypothetical protein